MPRVPVRKRQKHVKTHTHNASRVSTPLAPPPPPGAPAHATPTQAQQTEFVGSTAAGIGCSRAQSPASSGSSTSLPESLDILIPASDLSLSDGDSSVGPFSPPVINVSCRQVNSPDSSELYSDLSTDSSYISSDSSRFMSPEPSHQQDPLQHDSAGVVCSTPDPAGKVTPGCTAHALQDTGGTDPAHLSETLKQELLLQVRDKVTLMLRQNYVPCVDHDGIHIIQLSMKKEKSVQRRLFFSCTGDVEVSVHCKPQNAKMFEKIREKKPLTKSNINYFVDRIADAIEVLRQFEVCAGVEDYSECWGEYSGGEIDQNPYCENRYSKTYRSKSCKIIVKPRLWRCNECSKVLIGLKRRAKAASNDHKNKPNCTLSKEQTLNKLAAQQKEIRSTRRRLERMQAKMQELLEKEGVTIDDDLSKDLDDLLENMALSPTQALFIQQQLKASHAKKACGRRWHPSIIRLALSIHLKSPAAYRELLASGMVILPSTRTLFDYSHVKPATEGIDLDIVEKIAKTIEKSEHSYQKYHTLMCDEMYISKNLVYHKGTGNIIGFANISAVQAEMSELENFLENNDTSVTKPLASKMLSFLVKGVASSVKQVVASFAIDKLTKEQLYCYSWEVITKLETAGVAVIVYVMDGCSVNRSFMRMHKPVTVSVSGVVFDAINKAAPHRVLYFMSDVPHLLKTIRNCFNNSTEKKYVRKNGKVVWKRCLQKNGQYILWKTIVALYNAEKDQTLRQGFKLNAQNVFLNGYSCMRVGLAAQVMSNTVSELVKKKGGPGTEETAIFIKKVNDFFDMLNGAHTFHGKRKRNPNLDPYTSLNDPRFKKLDEFLDYLEEWKTDAENAAAHIDVTVSAMESFIDEPQDLQGLREEEDDGNETTSASKRQLSYQTLEGIEISIRGFQGAAKFLLQEGMKFINARVFCQDPIEQFFSKQRSRGGGNTNPNASAFINNAKMIHIQGQLGSKRSHGTGNTEVEDQDMELSYEPLPKRKSLFSLNNV